MQSGSFKKNFICYRNVNIQYILLFIFNIATTYATTILYIKYHINIRNKSINP